MRLIRFKTKDDISEELFSSILKQSGIYEKPEITDLNTVNIPFLKSCEHHDCIIISSIQDNMWIYQDLFSQLEYFKLNTFLIFYHLINDQEVEYCMSVRNNLNIAADFDSIVHRILSKHYKCTRVRSYLDENAKEIQEDLKNRLFRERILTELLYGCSKLEYSVYQKTFNYDISTSGFYILIYEQQYQEYYDHDNNKDVYNYIGESFKQECRDTLKKYNGGEVFDVTLNIQCIIFNEPKALTEMEKNNSLYQIKNELLNIMKCKNSSHYLSKCLTDSSQIKQIYHLYLNQRSTGFWGKDKYIILSEDSHNNFKEYYLQANELLQQISHQLRYHLMEPALMNSFHTLFFSVIKPSYSYDLFYYCITIVTRNINDVFGTVSTTISLPDPQQLVYSSVEEQYNRIITYITVLQTLYASQENSHNTYVLKVSEYISSHYSDTIKVSEIADMLHINEAYLSRIFKKNMGKSIVTYLWDFRIEIAKRMLKETDMQISEIAEDIGISDARYFSRKFRNMTGMTPGDYRNSMEK